MASVNSWLAMATEPDAVTEVEPSAPSVMVAVPENEPEPSDAVIEAVTVPVSSPSIFTRDPEVMSTVVPNSSS